MSCSEVFITKVRLAELDTPHHSYVSPMCVILSTGVGGGAEGGRVRLVLSRLCPVPVWAARMSCLLSPPPASRVLTPSAFTEQQKTFVGPHHGPKIFGQ